jgi:hypothetical protein
MTLTQPHPGAAQVQTDMQRWLERAVIGLNLCPFAKAVHVKGQIHYAVAAAGDATELLADLRQELLDLAQADPAERDTTLLVAPDALADFLDFNDFLGRADRLLRKLRLDGVLQIASFHPRYQFADAGPDDVSNCSNRAPYPTLHLLREDSIARAVQAVPDAAHIFERNRRTLNDLGFAGWALLGLDSSL